MASSGKGKSDGADHARDSFASLLAYYKDRDSTGSADIEIGMAAGTVPSDEQAEALREELAAALKHREIIEQLSQGEKQAMEQAANASRLRRVKGKGGATGQGGSSRKP